MDRKGKLGKTQLELNEAFEPLELEMAERYARIVSMSYIGLFFSPILPISGWITLVGVGIEYLVTKFMILRVHGRPTVLNEKLSL